MIFFHRPWVSKSYIQPQNPKQGPGYQHARRTCADSATAIARLLRLYEKHYTFRRINNQVVAIIFTAALMLIFITISMSSQDIGRLRGDDKNRQVDMAAHLNVCFRALDELGQSFENAKRTRDFLVSLQRRWQNHMRKTGTNSKRSLDSPATFAVKNHQSALGHDTSSTTDAVAIASNDPSSSSMTGKKKPRLSQSSILEDAGLGRDLLDHDLLPPVVDFGQFGGGLNWTPSSRDLKMLSEEIGDAPLFSTPSPSSPITSPRPPLIGGTTVTNGGDGAIPSLDEIASAWWNWPASSGGNSSNHTDGGANL